MFSTKKIFLTIILFLFIFTIATACNPVLVNLTLDANGGEFISGEDTYVVKITDVSDINMPEPTKEGYIFEGWFLDKDVWDEPYNLEFIKGMAKRSEITLFAKWRVYNLEDRWTACKELFSQVWDIPENESGFNYYSASDNEIINKLYFQGKPIAYEILEELGEQLYEVYTQDFSSFSLIPGTNIYASDLFSIFSFLTDDVHSVGENYYSRDNTRLIKYKGNSLSYNIPTGTQIIGSYAFKNFYNVEPINVQSITIPEGVTDIGYQAFKDCVALTSINVPDSLRSIGSEAFNNCSNLSEIIFSNNSELEKIGLQALDSTPWFNYQPDGLIYLGNCVYKYKGNMPMNSSIILPEGTKGIADKAFFYCKGLISITIPEGVRSIGSNAFDGCWNLSSITIPEGVTSIGSDAFNGCMNLISITIPEGVTHIGSNMFKGCSKLTSVNIPSSVTSIGNRAFEYCTSLESIVIPSGVTRIGENAFNNCRSLTSIVVSEINPYYKVVDGVLFNKAGTKLILYPQGNTRTSYSIPFDVISIGEYAFYSCSSLESITIPDSVTSIGDYAFYRCSSLESITIPNSVTSIGDYAFFYCSNLTSIIIPNSTTRIGREAFSYCKGLTDLTISEGVTSIDSDAFSDCTSLTSITIPSSVTSIGYGVFNNCSNLTSIVVSENNPYYRSIDGVLFNKAGTELIQYPFGNPRTEYVIPTGVKSVGEAFRNCKNLTSVTIPSSVTSIGYKAFYGCSSLISISIPSSVTRIGYEAFYGCSSLTSITINNRVTRIDSYAFLGCSSLTSISIPSSVNDIGIGAFSNCENLSSIEVSIENRYYKSIDGVLFNKKGTELLQYPGGKSTINYNIPNGVRRIEGYAFFGCSNLTSITIPRSVTSIGTYVFSDCSSLTSLYINSVNPPALDWWPFYNTHSQLRIYVPIGSVSIYKTAEGWSNYETRIYVKPLIN